MKMKIILLLMLLVITAAYAEETEKVRAYYLTIEQIEVTPEVAAKVTAPGVQENWKLQILNEELKAGRARSLLAAGTVVDSDYMKKYESWVMNVLNGYTRRYFLLSYKAGGKMALPEVKPFLHEKTTSSSRIFLSKPSKNSEKWLVGHIGDSLKSPVVTMETPAGTIQLPQINTGAESMSGSFVFTGSKDPKLRIIRGKEKNVIYLRYLRKLPDKSFSATVKTSRTVIKAMYLDIATYRELVAASGKNYPALTTPQSRRILSRATVINTGSNRENDPMAGSNDPDIVSFVSSYETGKYSTIASAKSSTVKLNNMVKLNKDSSGDSLIYELSLEKVTGMEVLQTKAGPVQTPEISGVYVHGMVRPAANMTIVLADIGDPFSSSFRPLFSSDVSSEQEKNTGRILLVMQTGNSEVKASSSVNVDVSGIDW